MAELSAERRNKIREGLETWGSSKSVTLELLDALETVEAELRLARELLYRVGQDCQANEVHTTATGALVAYLCPEDFEGTRQEADLAAIRREVEERYHDA